jgi:hypothetical protein
MGQIGVEVAAIRSGQALGGLFPILSSCIDAAVAVFEAPSNPNPTTAEVDIHTSPTDETSTKTVSLSSANSFGNCIDSPTNETFTVNVPFQMFVGTSPDREETSNDSGVFDVPPSGTSDSELIAQKLFKENDIFIAGITHDGPSISLVYTVPAHTLVRPSVPIKLSYRTGEGRVVHPDGSTNALPWLFTVGYQLAGDVTWEQRNCY